jgi:phosphoribosylformylglycinamidine synthase
VKYLVDGVVRGIGDYGNSFGVPTVAGEVYFDRSYEGNPLVNAMSVGIVKVGETASATAEGEGNPVYIVGSSTGRDGIHGATFASEEISESSESRRPSVQVGDPFTEKLLLEATLEAIRSGAVVGIQDMGAAGLTCSSCEMSAKGRSGMEIDVDLVPQRESGMTPYEIMLSESQERMLVVVESGKEQEIERIFDKWDLHAERIGRVTTDGRVRIRWHGEVVADIPAEHLVLGGGAPVYKRESKRPVYLDKTNAFDESAIPDVTPANAGRVLIQLIASPNIASKRWVFEQYDSMVRTNTVVGPGPSDAAVVRIKGTNRGLAVKTDCNGRYVYLNPRRGGQIAVAESARNVVCAGGKPLAVTNCLNFGNPYKPEVYWTFEEAVAGMGEACRVFDTPVTGGNVSFYNENPEGAVFPTPVIGMLGLVENVDRDATRSGFRQEGDMVYLLSPETWVHHDGIGGTEYLSVVHGVCAGDAPHLDLREERAVQERMLALIQAGLTSSVHDVSDGGLAVCLAESAIFSGLGCDVDFATATVGTARMDAVLFGEAQSRIVFTTRPGNEDAVKQLADGFPVSLSQIGTVAGDSLSVKFHGSIVINERVETLSGAYEGTLPSALR